MEHKAPGQPRPLYEQFAIAFDAYTRSGTMNNLGWQSAWRDRIEWLANEHMPSGSGVDGGTLFDFDLSKPDKLIFTFGYHHMENGYYSAWTDHSAVVKPSFIGGYDLTITGRDRNNIKDYLAELFNNALGLHVEMPGHIVPKGGA